MRATAAIPADGRHDFGQLLASIAMHGFDEVLILWIGEDAPPAVTGYARIVHAHPDYLLEVALHEVLEGWVFIFYPGETIEGEFKVPQKGVFATIDGQVRGFRRDFGEFPLVAIPEHAVAYEPKMVDAGARLGGTSTMPVAVKKQWPEPTKALTVVLPTWRLGGLDVTLGALAKQTFKDFEVIVVDALHRYRAHCKGLSGVVHLPIDNDIFPMSSHSRFRNTAIRRAQGRRLVFLSDYAVPSPDFLAKHAEVPDNHIGIMTWLRTLIRPEAIRCPTGLTPWQVIEHAAQGEFLWSTLGPDAAGEVIARFPVDNALLGAPEFLGHYKSDSVPTHLARLVNGWDEEFDGCGAYADTDFTLRLLWAGAELWMLKGEVPVLDAHDISVAPITDHTRDNKDRLLATRMKRLVRCVFGLEHGIR